MYDDFFEIYDSFKVNEVEDPLRETLQLFDVLSKRALRETDLSVFNKKKIDYSFLAQKRKEGIPLEYIIGMAPFLGRMFYCSSAALIPREETELLTKVGLSFIKEKQEVKKNITIIDMGTGCGNIAVSLALNSEDTHILASDLSPDTIQVTKKNVEKYNLQNRITLSSGDLFSPISETDYKKKIDMIVCNPPYIPSGSLHKLSPEIIEHEPKEAFDAGAFGIDFFRRLINGSKRFLKPKGILVFEIGAGQEKLVTRLIERSGDYHNIEYYKRNEQIRVISAEMMNDQGK